jgi:HD-like signal output (HDOD) protein
MRDGDAAVRATDTADVEDRLGKAIGDIGIPPCPAVLTRIHAEMAKEEPDFKQVDAAVSSDVALAAGLVALANSPFFGLHHRARSVREALQFLGLATTSRAIAGLILRKIFPATAAMDRFWDSSARIARLSGWLAGNARITAAIPTDEAYTFGLFRDCGIPVLLKRFPGYATALAAANADPDSDFTSIEEAACGTHHAAVGGLLAQAWWLPDDVSLAVRHHHARNLHDLTLPRASQRLIAVAHLAEHLLQRHTGLCRTQEWPKVGAACLDILGIAETRLPDIYEASAPIATDEAAE